MRAPTMKKATIAGGVLVTVLVVLALAAGRRALERGVDPAASTSPETSPSPAVATEEAYQGFLYGRITGVGGANYDGRLRWGGDQEAFWGDYFNGAKRENPWAAQAPLERLPKERRPIEILGFAMAQRERQSDLGRPRRRACRPTRAPGRLHRLRPMEPGRMRRH